MRGFRPLADGPLLGLGLLAFGFLASVLTFVLRQTLPYDPFVACQTLAATILARAASLGVLLPAALVAISVLAAMLALAHQAWATRRMLGRVLALRQPVGQPIARLGARLGIAGRIDLVDDPDVYTFCHGYLRPRVCVSRGLVELLGEAELAAVLAHESHHLRHRDPLKILLGRSLATALFFMPLAGALRNAFLAGKELSADAAAALAGGELSLASALLKMLDAERPTWPAGVLAIGAMSPTEARLLQLVERQPVRPQLPTVMDWVISAAMAAGIFGFGFGSAAAVQAEPIHAACAAPAGVPVERAQAASPATIAIAPSPFQPDTTELILPAPAAPAPHLRPCDLLCTRQLWLAR